MKPVRTTKVLFALARGAWIVTPEWIHTSVEQGKTAAEDDFETKHFVGAALARQNAVKRGPGLFAHTKFYLHKEPLPALSRDVLAEVLLLAGGMVR